MRILTHSRLAAWLIAFLVAGMALATNPAFTDTVSYQALATGQDSGHATACNVSYGKVGIAGEQLFEACVIPLYDTAYAINHWLGSGPLTWTGPGTHSGTLE